MLINSTSASAPPYHEIVDINSWQFAYDGETGGLRLPTYEELLKLFESLSLEKKRIAEEAMADEVAKSQTTDVLRTQVRALAGSAAAIDGTFESVRLSLKMLDNKNYRDEDDRLIRKFHPTWVEFQKRWTTLLWDSYQTATATEAYVQEFVTIIIPILTDIKTEEDRNDALQDLQCFIERKDPSCQIHDAEGTRDEGANLSQAFLNLQQDINDFAKIFDAFKVKEDVKLRDKENQEELKRLKNSINKCCDLVSESIHTLEQGSKNIGMGMLSVFATLNPFVAGTILSTGLLAVGIGGTQLAKSGLEIGKIRTAIKQREQEQEKIQRLFELEKGLQSQKPTIHEISARFDDFGIMWKQVAHDAETISYGLTACANASLSKELGTRLTLIQHGYTALGAALHEYGTQVDRSGVRKLGDYENVVTETLSEYRCREEKGKISKAPKSGASRLFSRIALRPHIS